jgi:hypothetical protein
MDEAELKLETTDLTQATREFAWFAVILLCLMTLVVCKHHF